MTRPKLALAALLTAALVVASLPLAVFAQAAPRLRITDTIYKQLPGGEKKDLTFAHLSHFTDPNNFYATAGADLETFKRDSSAALDNGAWGFTQYTFTVGDRPAGTPMFFFTQKRDCNFTIHYFPGSDRFDLRAGSTDPGCRFSYLSSNGDSSRFYYKPSYATGVTLSTGKTDATRLLFFTGDYTLDPSAEGLVPEIPKDINEKRQPHFFYTLNEKSELIVTYLENVKEHSLGHCKWHWELFQTTPDFSSNQREEFVGDVSLLVHTHTLSSYGPYKLTITPSCDFSNVPAPIWPRPSMEQLTFIRPVVLTFVNDGTWKKGGTFYGTCKDGVCSELPVSCDNISDGVRRAACRINQSFNFGVINPSLFAIRSLMTSFIVPAKPACSFPLPLTGSSLINTFSPSQMVASACSKAPAFHAAFPLAAVLVNFSVALFLLWLVIRMLANLTDHRRDELIGEM